MAVMRLDPFAGFERMFDTLYGRGEDARRSMPIDIYRKGDRYVVEMDLPGADPDSIEVSVERNMLNVAAETRSSHENADEQIVCERRHARFTRQVYLGDDLDTERVEASFDNGVLTLTIPVNDRAHSRRIEVTTGGGGSRAIAAESSDNGRSRPAEENAQT